MVPKNSPIYIQLMVFNDENNVSLFSENDSFCFT